MFKAMLTYAPDGFKNTPISQIHISRGILSIGDEKRVYTPWDRCFHVPLPHFYPLFSLQKTVHPYSYKHTNVPFLLLCIVRACPTVYRFKI